jgi:hypothetical protein
MSDVVCFLGMASHCEGTVVHGKFVRDDGRVIDDLSVPLSAFNIPPPPGTVIIAKTRIRGDGPLSHLDMKFRTVTLEEVKFLDRVEMAEAFNWIREAKIEPLVKTDI